MTLALVAVIIVTAALSWWLSGCDSRLTGHDRTADLTRRFIRCGITVVLVGFGADQFLSGGVFGGFICVIILLPLAILWAGCITELSAHGINGVIDPNDDREFDPKEATRNLDRLASLIQSGRNDEAIALCHDLLNSNGISALAMHTMLDRLYCEKFSDEHIASAPFLAEARLFCDQCRFDEAVQWLDALLAKDPSNLPAILLKMQIQVRCLQRTDKAHESLQMLDQLSGIPPGFTDFARRRIADWNRPVSTESKSTHGIESLLVKNEFSTAPNSEAAAADGSVDELLAAGNLTAAIELLEKATREQPGDFESWLKLAKAHGVYCQNFPRARKLVDKIALNPAFTPEQVQQAKAALREWQAGH